RTPLARSPRSSPAATRPRRLPSCAGSSPRRSRQNRVSACRSRHRRERPAQNSMTSIDAIVARLLTLHPKRIDLSLDRMWRLLERLDHPEKRLPPVIPVAGPHGHGSTIPLLRAELEAARPPV